MERFIFFRIGWMDRYQGLDGDDIEGGGGFVDKYHYGHEILNFQPFEGRLYGFGETREGIRIERLGATAEAPSVSGVTVVYVARPPTSSGLNVVGWYGNATVFRHKQEPTWVPSRRMDRYIAPDRPAAPWDVGRHMPYVATTVEADAHLIHSRDRDISIPTGRGGFGQFNVWYADSDAGARCKEDLLEYIERRMRS